MTWRGLSVKILWSIFLTAVPIWLCSRVQAGESAQSSAEVLHLVDLLSARYNRSALQDDLSSLQRNSYRSVRYQLDPVDPLLIDELQWASPNHSLKTCRQHAKNLTEQLIEMRLTRPPTQDAELLPLLIEQARVQLQLNQPSEALESLTKARQRISCSEEILKEELIARLFWHEGVAHALLTDGMAEDALADALYIDPALKPDKSMTKGVHKAYDAAKKSLVALPRLTLDLGYMINEVYLNGSAVAPGTQVRPGRHVLQAKRGVAEIRSILVNTPAQESVRVDWLMNNELPSRERAIEILAGSLRAGEVNAWQAQVLEGYLKKVESDALYFVLEDIGSQHAVLRLYVRGQGVREGQLFVTVPGGLAKKTPAPDFLLGLNIEHFNFGEIVTLGTLGGPTALVNLPTQKLTFDIHGSILWPMGDASACLADSATTACYAVLKGLKFGIGFGYVVRLPVKFWLIPGVAMDLVMLDQVLGPEISADVRLLLPSARLELRREILYGAVQMGIEFGGGLSFVLLDNEWRRLNNIGGRMSVGVGW